MILSIKTKRSAQKKQFRATTVVLPPSKLLSPFIMARVGNIGGKTRRSLARENTCSSQTFMMGRI